MAKPGTAVAPIQVFKEEITLRKDMFHDMLPKHVPVEKFQANLVAACTMTPTLLGCDRNSLLRAAMTAAQLGLMVDPVLGHAYLIPYGKIVQCIPGYKGLIHLARQSGEIANLYAHEVYSGDRFEIELGTNKRIVHVPRLSGDRGEMIGVYAAWSYSKATDNTGKPVMDFEFMTMEEIEAIRKRSKASDSGPWKTDYIQMARKTVIRRASKYLPLSVQRAAVLDQAYDMGADVDVADGEIIMHDAVDITDPTPPSQAGAKQASDLEKKIVGKNGAAKQTDAPTATGPLKVIDLPDFNGVADWDAWTTQAMEALTALPEAARKKWYDAHKKIIDRAAEEAPDVAAQIEEAVG